MDGGIGVGSHTTRGLYVLKVGGGVGQEINICKEVFYDTLRELKMREVGIITQGVDVGGI